MEREWSWRGRHRDDAFSDGDATTPGFVITRTSVGAYPRSSSSYEIAAGSCGSCSSSTRPAQRSAQNDVVMILRSF